MPCSSNLQSDELHTCQVKFTNNMNREKLLLPTITIVEIFQKFLPEIYSQIRYQHLHFEFPGFFSLLSTRHKPTAVYVSRVKWHALVAQKPISTIHLWQLKWIAGGYTESILPYQNWEVSLVLWLQRLVFSARQFCTANITIVPLSLVRPSL